MVIQIQDRSDPRVAAYRNLRDVELRRSLEAEHGVFVVEGSRSVKALLESPFPAVSLLFTPARLDAAVDLVAAAQRRGSPVYVAGPDVFDGIAGFHVHRGVLALAQRLPMAQPEQLLAKADAVVIVEGVNDHENLGSIFRLSEAARRLANRHVRIPMTPGVDSLNVATALAIGLERLIVR